MKKEMLNLVVIILRGREMKEMVMKGGCHLSLSTCHAVVLIDVLCACLIAHYDPETRNQTGGSNCKTIKTLTKKNWEITETKIQNIIFKKRC